MSLRVRPLLLLVLTFLVGCREAPGRVETQPAAIAVTALSSREPPGWEGALATATPPPTQVARGDLSPVLKMSAGRATHTATLLPDGRVLLAGGFRSEGTAEVPIPSAEIYDPGSNSFSPTGDLNEARSGHTATLLPDGRVLIAGGWGLSGRLSSAEIYDPQTGRFTPAASMFAPRASMTATLLLDGKVLFAGGDSARNAPQPAAELYDPATDTFRQAGSLREARSAHTATLLEDGSVLLVGGHTSNNRVLASAEIYNPDGDEFALTGNLNLARHKHAAVLLQDGTVLALGGANQDDWNNKFASAEIYDPETGTFAPTADLNRERFKLSDAVVLLDDGNVLVGGGNRQVEIFDAQSRRFVLSEALPDAYYYTVLTLLRDGRVLITGGYDADIRPSDKAWVYTVNP